MANVPQNREAAIAALVEQDVAKWGESERAESQRSHAGLSYGRALNTLATRAQLSGDEHAAELRAAAKAALTATDKKALRREGGDR